jgi:hypothetical protein
VEELRAGGSSRAAARSRSSSPGPRSCRGETYERKIARMARRGTPRRALLEAADPRGVPQHRLFRRGLLRREAASRGYFGKSAADLSWLTRRCSPRWCDRLRPMRRASRA